LHGADEELTPRLRKRRRKRLQFSGHRGIQSASFVILQAHGPTNKSLHTVRSRVRCRRLNAPVTGSTARAGRSRGYSPCQSPQPSSPCPCSHHHARCRRRSRTTGASRGPSRLKTETNSLLLVQDAERGQSQTAKTLHLKLAGCSHNDDEGSTHRLGVHRRRGMRRSGSAAGGRGPSPCCRPPPAPRLYTTPNTTTRQTIPQKARSDREIVRTTSRDESHRNRPEQRASDDIRSRLER